MIINDDLELAVAGIEGVAGVHLGQSDLVRLGLAVEAGFPAADDRDARQQLAVLRERGLWLGISTHSLAQLQDTIATLAPDYVGFGPVFATGSKPRHEPVVGVEGLAVLVQPRVFLSSRSGSWTGACRRDRLMRRSCDRRNRCIDPRTTRG